MAKFSPLLTNISLHTGIYFSDTVPLKCKLPPLVSFLARRVSFLARQFSFPARRVSFLARSFSFLSRITEAFSMEYITRKKSLPKWWNPPTRRDDKKDSSLQLLASLKIISIYLVLFGRIGWFKHWNSPNLQKKCFIEVLTMRCKHSFNFWQWKVCPLHALARQTRKPFEISLHAGELWKVFDISGSIWQNWMIQTLK